MAHANAPGTNLSANPVVRKLEQKVQALEKRHSEEDRQQAELIQRLDVQAQELKALEAKVGLLMRNLKEMQRGATATSAPRTGFLPPGLGDDLIAPQTYARPAPVQEAIPAPSERMSLAKLDALLSNLGIRMVEAGTETMTLEPLNAYGAENLRTLGFTPRLQEVEEFVKAKADLA